MTQPTAIVAEDEPLLRAELREMRGKLWPELAARLSTTIDRVKQRLNSPPVVVAAVKEILDALFAVSDEKATEHTGRCA